MPGTSPHRVTRRGFLGSLGTLGVLGASAAVTPSCAQDAGGPPAAAAAGAADLHRRPGATGADGGWPVDSPAIPRPPPWSGVVMRRC
ncbi:MAG: hypothetical protein L0J86_08660, partial [Corynebacterium sp.]|nr:hypothetical protein [Corynebacterium sp.]